MNCARMSCLAVLCAGLFLASGVVTAADYPTHPTVNVPKLAGIAVDGNPADWDGNGFRVRILTPQQGALRGTHAA